MQKYKFYFPYFRDQFYSTTKQFLHNSQEFSFLGNKGHLSRENLLAYE